MPTPRIDRITRERICASRLRQAGLALAMMAGSVPAAADKTDILDLRNGDRVTCEIKNLERGRLKVSTVLFAVVCFRIQNISPVPQIALVCYRPLATLPSASAVL